MSWSRRRRLGLAAFRKPNFLFAARRRRNSFGLRQRILLSVSEFAASEKQAKKESQKESRRKSWK